MTKREISSEICTPCGECCRHFPYIEISNDDIQRLIEHTGLKQEDFTNIKDIEKEEYFLKFNDNGDCVFFEENNFGLFSCGVYKARPVICANYPVTDKQFDHCEKIRIAAVKG